MRGGFPDWAGLTPESAAAELPRLLDGAEAMVAAIEAAEPKTYEGLVWALDDATRKLWRLWGMVSHLLGVMNSEAWRKVEEGWQPKVVAFSLRVSQSKRLYELAKSCLAAPDVDPVRRRILEKMAQGAELAGVGLEGEKKVRFNEIQMKLAKLGADFHNAVIDATAAFKYEKDGKVYAIDDANYPETMKHCADREVREKLYRARATRAPENEPRIAEILKLRQEEAEILGFGSYAEKSLVTKCAPGVAAVLKMLDDLDKATVEKSKLDETDLSASTKTLDNSGTQALEPWDLAYAAERLREKKYAYGEEELKRHFELEDVVKGLFRMVKFLFDVEVEEVAEKPSVWHEDVRFFKVVERGETVAHFYFDPFVRSGLKSGGAWMNEFRNRRKVERSEAKDEGEGEQRNFSTVGLGPSPWPGSEAKDEGEGVDGGGGIGLWTETPLAVVVTNFPKPDGNGKCFLPFREVETLFHEFGHALQCMLTRVDEEDAAGINLVEWDAVEVASQFMENWCLDDRTGISVPAELKAKVRAAKNFRAATACRRQLAFAKTDMLLHCSPSPSPFNLGQGEGPRRTADEFPCSPSLSSFASSSDLGQGEGPRRTVEKFLCSPSPSSSSSSSPSPFALKEEIFTHFGLPMVAGDKFLCSFTHIFAGGYAAGYYGYKWAEVMSADCYGAFEEAGLSDDAALRRLGMKYRETVLALGGAKSALEVFREFRGRTPEIAALLRQQDLI